MAGKKFLYLMCLVTVCFGWPAGWGTALAQDGWRIRINIPECQLYLYRGSEVYQHFFVAVGRSNSPSPIGNFKIINKALDPTWYPPDGRKPVPPGPQNPLGRYWMGLNRPGYGIHGNNAAWSIGNPVSRGCFRMYNNDIKLLFSLIPVGTPVEITYLTVVGELDQNRQPWLKILPDIYHREDQGGIVQKTLTGLGWNGEPHPVALQELLSRQKPILFEVPSRIRVEGDLQGWDAFYWNQRIYLAAAPAAPGEEREFAGYRCFQDLADQNPGQWKYEWSDDHRSVAIYRFKLYLNGIPLPGAGKRDNERRLWVDFRQIASELNLEPFQPPAAGSQPDESTGEPEWLELDTLVSGRPGFSYIWYETTWTLRLEYRPEAVDHGF